MDDIKDLKERMLLIEDCIKFMTNILNVQISTLNLHLDHVKEQNKKLREELENKK